MIQKEQYALEVPTIFCRNPEHEGYYITHVCVKDSCKETRAHCTKCNLKMHRDCLGYVKLLEEIITEIYDVEKKNNQILEILDQALKKIYKLCKQLKSGSELINNYNKSKNQKNLNNLAEILQSYSDYDINKLLQGQEQFENLFLSQIVQNFIQNIDDSHNIKENNQQQKQNEQIQNVQPIQRPKIISIIENTGNQKYFEKNQNNENKQDQKLPVNQLQNQEQFDIQRLEKQIELKEPQLNDNIIKPPQQNLNIPITDEQASAQYLQQGQLHQKRQRYAEALELYDLAIVLNPNCPVAWNNKGTALGQLDRGVESIECFDRALEIINSRPQIDKKAKMAYLRNKASALQRLQQFDNSIQTINESIALDPQNENVIQLKFLSLLQSNQFNEALHFLDEASQQDSSNHLPFQLKVGIVLLKLKKFDEAIEQLGLANSIKPTKETYLYLGQALEELSQFDEAEQCYKVALKLDQTFNKARQQLTLIQQYNQGK